MERAAVVEITSEDGDFPTRGSLRIRGWGAVVIVYVDNETSGNRVFNNLDRAKRWPRGKRNRRSSRGAGSSRLFGNRIAGVNLEVEVEPRNNQEAGGENPSTAIRATGGGPSECLAAASMWLRYRVHAIRCFRTVGHPVRLVVQTVGPR